MLRPVCQISWPGHLEVNTLSERKIFTPCTWQLSYLERVSSMVLILKFKPDDIRFGFIST